MEQSKFYQIKNVTEHEYTLVGCDGSVIIRPIQDIDKTASVFTIQDAKDGDVLAGNKGDVILMFRRIGNAEWNDVIDYHCYYDCYRKDFIVQKDVQYWGDTNNNQLKPATKEQCDLLFQKMKEAGYEWDAEKKELKKIELKPAWSDEDDAYKEFVISAVEDFYDEKNPLQKTLIDWLKSLKDRIGG